MKDIKIVSTNYPVDKLIEIYKTLNWYSIDRYLKYLHYDLTKTCDEFTITEDNKDLLIEILYKWGYKVEISLADNNITIEQEDPYSVRIDSLKENECFLKDGNIYIVLEQSEDGQFIRCYNKDTLEIKLLPLAYLVSEVTIN